MASTLPSLQHTQQKGMAMIVVLIFLLVLTLLGVSSMTTTSLEERMATNSQIKTATFQAAETAITETLANTDNFYNVAASVTKSQTNNYTAGKFSASAVLALSLNGASDPIVRDEGSGFVGLLYDITATSSESGTGANTVNTQGAEFIVANSDVPFYIKDIP